MSLLGLVSMRIVVFVTGIAVVEMRRVRYCITRYVLARDDLRKIGILNDVEACLIPASGLDGYLIAHTSAVARIGYTYPQASALLSSLSIDRARHPRCGSESLPQS